MSDRCNNCGAEQDDHYDGIQFPLGQGLYSSEKSFQRIGEVEWRISPKVMSDLMNIITKHGMGLPDLDEDMRQVLFGDRKIGPEAASLEIIEKYNLRPYVPLKLVVDYKMGGYDRPDYWKLEKGEENGRGFQSNSRRKV
jgi:hypothetical protein